MSKKMLIDATNSEETRVVIIENGVVEELDVDTSTKKQLKGNIYLAKVVRVEPSLQAAFVDYGGNRHGFLAFGEIHPDYYQIPVADREALKELMNTSSAEPEEVEKAAEDVDEVIPADEIVPQRPNFFKKYRIQEVVRQGQIMLVQVVKEERGNKGAALTTYLSLAGRYSVLMPNNGKGGGVSRKITNAKDRKTLRAIVDKLPIPQGMSVIIRTAGQGKTSSEVKRDYDYLIKTWMKIRELTLDSLAPALIHEEGDIVKRSLRDIFTPDIDEIWVEGESVYKEARAFLKLLMPGQVKKVKQYKGSVPLFVQEEVESQLEAVHSNIVQLKSGGYLVIDQTEALVAVDVNSGRSTREHDIEETALRTNLETCDELARQLRLRDMAGLVVIDFIDMEEPKNNSAVERHLKEALKKDRARIQVGKMSGFGLMEMSRQRLHSSYLESSYRVCPCCKGIGVIRSVESCAMRSLHILEEAAVAFPSVDLVLKVPVAVALYLLNNKRTHLAGLEEKYKVSIQVQDGDFEQDFAYELFKVLPTGEKILITLPGHSGTAGVVVPEKNNKKNQKQSGAKKKQNKEPDVKNEEEKHGENAPVSKKNKKHFRDRKRKHKAPAELMNEGEDKFTIVQQEPLVVYDSHSKRAEDKTADVSVHSEVKPEPQEQNTSDVMDAVFPEKKKGGWWNRLVK